MTNSSTTPGDPLMSRYAGQAMAKAFDPTRRYLLWRDVWIALAEAQQGVAQKRSRRNREPTEPTARPRGTGVPVPREAF